MSPEELSRGRGPAPSSAAKMKPAPTAADVDLGADPDGMSVEETYAVVGSIERRHKAVLEDLRRELSLAAARAGAGRSGTAQASSGSAAVVAAAAAAVMASKGGDGDPEAFPGAATLFGKVSQVRVALSRALGSLVRRDPAFSLRKRLPNRLWMAHYRELEVIQQRLRQLIGGAKGGGGGTAQQKRQKEKQQQALRARLFALIQEAERDIGGMVETVEQGVAAAAAAAAATSKAAAAASSAPSENGDLAEGSRSASGSASEVGGGGDDDEGSDGDVDSAEGGLAGSVSDSEDDEDPEATLQERGRQQALQVFLTSLGDLSRYRGLHDGEKEGGGGGGGKAAWARAQDLYLRALRVDPSSGKVRTRNDEK